MQLKMIPCPKCGNDFPEKRKELGYHVCVNCSTTKPVVGITTVEGSGDHTYNDLIIMDQDKAFAIQAHADEIAGKKSHFETIDYDSDDDRDEYEVSQSLKDKTRSIDEGEDEQEYDSFDPNKEPEGIEGIDY